jgi:hypothetical protein
VPRSSCHVWTAPRLVSIFGKNNVGVFNVVLTADIELQARQETANQCSGIGADISVIAQSAKCNLRTTQASILMNVKQQTSVFWRFISGVLNTLEAVNGTLRACMILPFIHSADASPTRFVHDGMVQLSALDLVPTSAVAISLGRWMTDAITFQRSQGEWTYGLILLSISLTVISSFVLNDSTGDGPACLVSVFVL